MTTATLKCTYCKERFPREQMIPINAGNFCSDQHILDYALAESRKRKQKDLARTYGRNCGKTKEQPKLKDKTCPICCEKFTPWITTQHVNSVKCAIEWNRRKDEEASRKKDLARKKAFYGNDLTWQHKQTQKAFNKLRKLQEFQWFDDRGLEPECISCGKTKMDWCCGHLKTVGSQGALRYSETNTYLQCNRYCNMALSGNLNGNKTTRGYLQGLKERFGKEKAEIIINWCARDRVKTWTCNELIELRREFSKEIKRLTSG